MFTSVPIQKHATNIDARLNQNLFCRKTQSTLVLGSLRRERIVAKKTQFSVAAAKKQQFSVATLWGEIANEPAAKVVTY
jgi:hypothetical protein